MSATELQDLANRDRTSEILQSAGLSQDAGGAKAEMFGRCAEVLRDQAVTGERGLVAYYVPGRIEVLGKHTDYAGGRSLLATAQRGFCLVAVARPDDLISVRSAIDRSSAAFRFNGALTATVGDWSNYPITVARRLARNFPGKLKGASIVFASDLPIAAGMSSSSALVVATMLALSAINRLDETDWYRREIRSAEELAAYLGCIENGQSFGRLAGDRGVGTFGGSEDHVAMLCAQAGRLRQYSYCPVRAQRTIELPQDHLLAIACSGVVAEKTRSARERYNRLSQSTLAIVDLWQSETGRHDQTLADAIASMPDAIDRLRRAITAYSTAKYSTGELLARLEHFVTESEQIVPGVPDSLQGEGLREFGRLVDRSQASAETLLGNQTPETVFLARRARQLDAAAASAFGAGFGGSVWALIARQDAGEFLNQWQAGYRHQFAAASRRAEFFLTPAGPPVIALHESVV